jgi:hypothetical protein
LFEIPIFGDTVIPPSRYTLLLGMGVDCSMSLRDCDESRREQKEEKTSAFSDCNLSYLLYFQFLYYPPV